MSEEFYTSKFTGEEIDSRLEKVDNIPKNISELNNDVGYVDEEDMSNIEKEIKSLNDKVDNLEVGVGGGFKWIDV
jgi:polyhydroxyalkanoate synthesis regulator phasin